MHLVNTEGLRQPARLRGRVKDVKLTCPVVPSQKRQPHAESCRYMRNQFPVLYITEISVLCYTAISTYYIFLFSWLAILCGSDTQSWVSHASKCIAFQRAKQTHTIFWVSLIVKDHRHETSMRHFFLFLVFILIILPGSYDPLGFSPITELSCECLLLIVMLK